MKWSTLASILLIAFLNILHTNYLFSQNNPEKSIPGIIPGAFNKTQHHWFNAGMGGSSAGISGGISFSFNQGNQLSTLRLLNNQEFEIFGPSPAETVWDAGILYGGCVKGKYGFASIASGIAMVGGVQRGRFLYRDGWFGSTYEKKSFYTAGIPVEAQLFFTPIANLGIGICGFGNLNAKKSFGGLLLCLQIGRLR